MKYLLNGEETSRLHFRLLSENDFDQWLPFFTYKEAYQYLGVEPKPEAEQMCTDWINRMLNRYENNEGGMNVLIDKQSGKMIGQCGLLVQDVMGNVRLEIGYSILPEFWHNGYATEAAIHCKNKAFEKEFENELISLIHRDNIGSKKVALNNGMELEQFLPNYRNKPVNVFKITREEWLTNR